MAADYHPLCAELVKEVEGLYEALQDLGYGWITPESEALIARAHNALAESVELPPRPPVVTAMGHPDLVRYSVTWDGSPNKPLLTPRQDGYWTPWHVAAELLERLAVPEPLGPTDKELDQLAHEMWIKRESTQWAVRTALARWGRPALAPIPVSERLPERNPDSYVELQRQAAQAAGPGGPIWNQAYIKELQQRDLVLVTVRPAGDCAAWYSHGAPMLAPIPHPEGGFTWPTGTLICWAPKLETLAELEGRSSDAGYEAGSMWAGHPVTLAADDEKGGIWKIVLSEDNCAPDAHESFERDFRRFSGGLSVGSFKSLAQFEESNNGMTISWRLGGVELSTSADDPFYCVRKRTRTAELLLERQTGAGAAGVTDPISELISQCRPLEPEMAECLTPQARWRLYGEDSVEEWEVLKEHLWNQHSTCGYQGEKFMYENDFDKAMDKALWGRPAITPTPVSERLPGPEDCDAEGRCWVGSAAFTDDTDYGPMDYNNCWELCHCTAGDYCWLPAHALPLPQGCTK